MLPQPLDEMIAALRAEIVSSRRSQPGVDERVVKLTNGELIEKSDDSYTYRFRYRQWPNGLEPEFGLLLKSSSSSKWHPVDDEPQYDGKSVTITCAAYFGNSSITVTIRRDPAGQWEAVASQLEDLADTSHSKDLYRALTILKGKSQRSEHEHRSRELVYEFDQLNFSQQRAVTQSLASAQTFIWGPPGTGKTEVIARIVQGSVQQGLRVLFLAPTRVAVDQALERICKLLEHVDGFNEGLVRREGEITVGSLIETYGSYIEPGKTFERCARALNVERAELDSEAKTLQVEMENAKKYKNEKVTLEAIRGRLQMARQYLQSSEERLAKLCSERDEIQKRMTRYERLPQAISVFSKNKIADLSGRQEQLGEEIENIKFTSIAHTDELRRLKEVEREAISRFGALDVPSSTLQCEWDVLQKRRASQEQRYKRLRGKLNDTCKVNAMTIQKAARGGGLWREADVVVVDEAGMVDLPTAFVVASKASKRLVFAGDFRQLAAIVAGHEDKKSTLESRRLVEKWIARDVFEAAGLVGPNGSANADERLVQLDTQYRMRSEICELVNNISYPDARLKTGRDNATTISPSALLMHPLMLIDTSATPAYGGATTRNHVHAGLVREIVRLLQRDGVLPVHRSPNGDPRTSLAIITPYRGQVRAIEEQMKDRFGEVHPGLVDTVHRFQGSQRSIVLFDTVSGSNVKKLGRFMEGVGLQSSTCRLLNVSLSRARDFVLVLANVDHMKRLLNPASEVLTMLHYLETTSHRVDLGDLIPTRAADDLVHLNADESARLAFFPADETDEAVIWDIKRTQKRLDVYSPFSNSPRSRKFLPLLGEAVDRGVMVRLFARGTEETPQNRALIDKAVSLGCDVTERDQMHEKILVADDVLWMGSMNIFAHTRSTELMMRMESKGACDSVTELVQKAQPTRKRSDWAEVVVTDDQKTIYLSTPYEEKDDARALGARWDRVKKQWYVHSDIDNLHEFDRWR